MNLLFDAQMIILFSMPKRTPPIFPTAARQLTLLGKRLRAARLQRRMPQATLAVRADVSFDMNANFDECR